MWSESWPVNRLRSLVVRALIGLCACLVCASCAAPRQRVPKTVPTNPFTELVEKETGLPDIQPPSSIISPHLRFPDSEYITAWGISHISSVEAENDAKAQVSAQIASRIEAVTESVATATMRNEQSIDTEDLSSTIRVRTEFERAELIRIDRRAPGMQDGRYRAFAYLDRAEYVQILEAEYAADAVIFRENAGRLPTLTRNLAAYTIAYRKLRPAFINMAPVACRIQAAAREPYTPFLEDQSSMTQAEADRGALLRDLRVAVKINPAENLAGNADPNSMPKPDLNCDAIGGTLRTVLSTAGIGTLGTECSEGGLLLELTPYLKWDRIMGLICSLRLGGSLSTCDGAVLTEISITDKRLRASGNDPQGKLVNNMTPELMCEFLLDQIRDKLPIF